jgi:XrtJ-associated TM-motif-TM protein
MNLKKTAFALGLACILAMALPLRAQTGCVDSPEDPTIVLALVGGAGTLAAGLWRARKR